MGGGFVTTAEKVLVVGGVLNLAWGVLTGYAAAAARRSSPEVPKYLMLTHMGGLMQGVMLLALVLAVGLSELSSGTETLSAVLLVGASGALDLKDGLNWVQGVRDEFAEKSAGYYLGALSAVLITGGLGILIVGVFRGL
jgi:hypothetical protein